MQVSSIKNQVIAVTHTIENFKDLTDFILKQDWTPFTFDHGYRTGSNWQSCDLMVLDIDNDGEHKCTLLEAKELFKDYTYLITTSKSHQIEKNGVIADRFRVIILLTSPIVDKEVYKNTWYSLSNKYPFIDQQCKDFARFYYKSKDFVGVNYAKTLDPVTVSTIPTALERSTFNMKLTKGRLSRPTLEFLANGVESGGRNHACFMAAKDLQEQGYTEDEAIDKILKSPSIADDFTDSEATRTIRSAYSNDPKYDPRNMSERRELVALNIEDLENDPSLNTKGDPVNGPSFWDCTESKWRKGEVLGLVAGSGGGKCHGADTPILMYDGSIKMVQDVVIGDKLMGPDSKPRYVLNTTKGTGELYKVNPVKGEPFIVNKDHVLSLKYNNTEKHYKNINKGDIVNISINEYLNKPKSFKSRLKGYRSKVDFECKQLKINPYILGLWLGDGSSCKIEITTMDSEIEHQWKDYGNLLNLKCNKWTKPNNKASTYSLSSGRIGGYNRNQALNDFKHYNLIDNKHIPLDYLTSSREQRLQLLAGLIDTDGYYHNGHIEISQKSDQLSKDILYLARSLGFAAYDNPSYKKCQNGNGGVYHRITISGDCSIIPTKLKRKQGSKRKQIKDVLSFGFKIESIGTGNYYGFEVDRDHLYLLGDFTVTHNSSVSLKIVRDILYNNPDSDDIHFFFSLEMPARQIVERWGKLVGKGHKYSKRLFVIDNKNTEERLTYQHIVKFVEDTCKSLNKKPGCVIIDHFMALSDKIDVTQQPNFDVSIDKNSGGGKMKTITVKEMCRLMKVIAERLDCFLLVQNQSTIERAGHGDTPMGINAAYGAAQFAWFCDYIITVWQPLKRVQSETALTCSGWQYSKIREIGPKDGTHVYTRHSIYYDTLTGDFRPLNELEEDEFAKYVEKANTLRSADEKNKTTQYLGSPKSRDNYQRILSSIDGGKKDNE